MRVFLTAFLLVAISACTHASAALDSNEIAIASRPTTLDYSASVGLFAADLPASSLASPSQLGLALTSSSFVVEVQLSPHVARLELPEPCFAAETSLAINKAITAGLDVDPGPTAPSLVTSVSATSKQFGPTRMHDTSEDIASFIGQLPLPADFVSSTTELLRGMLPLSTSPAQVVAELLQRTTDAADHLSVVLTVQKLTRGPAAVQVSAILSEAKGSIIPQYQTYIDEWSECCGFLCMKTCTHRDVKTRPRGNTPEEMLVIFNQLRLAEYQSIRSLVPPPNAAATQ